MKISALIAASILLAACSVLRAADQNHPFEMDAKTLIARADLDYTKPAPRSEAGMPVGNGRMGSLVWTTPTQLKFQINRDDVFAENCETNSFPERHSDYASGCAYTDIDLVDYGPEVFSGDAFHQHLNLYDALMTAEGHGVTAQVLAWNKRDVMAIEIDDHRAEPTPISINLRMLRFDMQYHPGKSWDETRQHENVVETRNHTATSRLGIRDGKIVLTQQFREGKFYDSSAVVAAIVGRKSQAKYVDETTVRLSAAHRERQIRHSASQHRHFRRRQRCGGARDRPT